MLAAAQVPPESVDLKTPPPLYGPGVERGGGRGIDGQGVDVQVRQSRVGGGPGAAGVGGLEDPAAVRPGVERGGGRGIDRQGEDVQVVVSPVLAAAQVPPESVDLKTPPPYVPA